MAIIRAGSAGEVVGVALGVAAHPASVNAQMVSATAVANLQFAICNLQFAIFRTLMARMANCKLKIAN
ncbi:MAG: hypothetical protein ACREIT_03055 [Tepidisphaeraceae bacterium]